MIRTVMGALASCLLALVLAGCSPQNNEIQPANHGHKFIIGMMADPPTYDGQAYVVLKASRDGPEGGKCGFIQIDPVTKAQIGTKSYVSHFGSKDYEIYRVPPGTYALAWAQNGRNMHFLVRFKSLSGEFAQDYLSKLNMKDAVARPEAPILTVTADETVYAGDLNFKFVKDQAVLNFGWNDQAAQAAFAAFGDTRPLTRRKWNPTRTLSIPAAKELK